MSTAVQTVIGSEARDATSGRSGQRQGESTRTSPKRLARFAGLLYLLVAVFGGFAQGFVYPKMFAAGDAATTVANVIANSGLVRIGVVADLINCVLWVFLAITLYRLLKHVHQTAAGTMVILVAIGAAIVCLNTVFEFEGLRVATSSSYAAALGSEGSNAIVLLLLEIQHYGIFIGQVFMGLWLMPLGYLAYKSSGMFPKWLGILLIVGGTLCYLVDLGAMFLVPDVGKAIHPFVGQMATAIAEITVLGYLLAFGVRAVKSAPISTQA